MTKASIAKIEMVDPTEKQRKQDEADARELTALGDAVRYLSSVDSSTQMRWLGYLVDRFGNPRPRPYE